MGVNKTSEAFDSARSEYIEGYVEKNKLIFPTLNLVAKEFKISLSTLRKKAANESWYKKRKQKESIIKILEKNLKCANNLKEIFQACTSFTQLSYLC